MEEIKADDSPLLTTNQLREGDQSQVQRNTSGENDTSKQVIEVAEKEKLAENPLSTPFMSKMNAPADPKAVKILSERPFFNNSNSRSSNFYMSNSNNSDDQNEDDLPLADHDPSSITKTFDLNHGTNLHHGDPENLLDQYRSRRPLIDEIANQTDAGLIPEAMPLIRNIGTFNTDENDIYARMKRGITSSYMCAKDPCLHDEEIQNWKCLKCNGNISRFGITFDDNQGKVSHFTKILYENTFLQDFKEDFKQQAVASGKSNSNGGTVLYTAYQPNNMVELKEYMMMVLCKKIKKINKAAAGELTKQSPFGTGAYQSLSGKLLKYLTYVKTKKEQLKQQYGEKVLVFDSMFESGNLLQAEMSPNLENTYNLYMQVDTNTRGHQQWFYFKAKGGKKGVNYTFNIMNFTKPGVTGGRGYKQGEIGMRIMVKSKKQQIINNNFEKWEDLTNQEGNGQCEYVKTHVARRRKDVIAAGADSDQEDWVEEAFNQPQAVATNQQNKDQLPSINISGPPQTGVSNIDPSAANKEKPKKRRVFYYYALRFNYQFKHDDDSVYFAFSQPVTYSEILTDIHNKEKILMPKNWEKVNSKKPTPFIKAPSSRMMDFKDKDKAKDQPKEANEDPLEPKYSIQKMMTENQFQKNILIENSQKLMYYHRTELCKTLSGMPLYQIVISRDQRSAKKNQIVLITSRVHSGESPGSQVFQGIYDFITSDCREAKYLRRFYTFILIPCMNPDGVIIGNYRNSLAGVDLNRQWINPDTTFHPEVCAVKNLMQQIKEEDKRQIWIFCDLHGHSKKKNSFFYGCNTAANGGFLSWTIVRLLPRIFAQKTHMFNYKDCRFRVEPYKIGTARIVAWKQFQITHSFTLENSFYGYDIGEDEDRIFTQEDYKNVGLKFTMAVYEMHILWKQIKRELQITHGWLKPRTLNDLTGVPAAQIMHEETAILKEEERKKKAIEQYEQFLKTFYKSSKPVFMRKPKKEAKLDKDKAQAILEKSNLKERDRNVLEAHQKSKESRNYNSSLQLTEDNYDKIKGKSQNTVCEEGHDSPTDKNRNNDDIEAVMNVPPAEDTLKEEDENSEDDSEFMFKMHQGLVKIQALIRGFLTRCRQKKKNLSSANKQLNKSISQQQNNRGTSREIPRQRSNQILKKSSSKKIKLGKLNPPSQMNLQVGYDTSSDGGMKGTAAGTTQVNNFESSNEDRLMRSNTEKLNGKNLSDSGQMSNTGSKDTANILGSLSQFGGKKVLGLQTNWREFFEGEELDKAYQIVEVEQRDETDQESLGEISMGSNSNPSEDNFDEEEVYQNIYGLKNPEQYLEIKKAKEQEFIVEVQSKDKPLTQQKLLQNISNLKPQEDKNDKSQVQVENLDNTNDKRKQSESETLINDHSVEHNVQNEEEKRKTIEEDKLLKTPKRLGQESEGKRKENTDKPKVQVSANHSPINGHEQNNENLFSNMTGNGRRMLKSSIQQRAFTSAQNHPQSNLNVGSQIKQTVQPVYKMHNSNKKENINQVIKECFITKKMNTKNSASLNGRQQTAQSISPQKQFQISSKKNKQLNLKMNQSLSNQFSISQAGFNPQNHAQGSVGQSNPRAAMIKQGSNKKNRIDLQGNERQGNNIEEALQNQNNILLQKIIQINLKNHNMRQSKNSNNRRAQLNQNQTRMNEVITIQLLEHLNQQMSGMNTLQANQYMQIVLMQLLQTNKIQNGEQIQNAQQFLPQQNGPSSEPGSQQNLSFYPGGTQDLQGPTDQDGQNRIMGKNQQVKRLVSDHNVNAAGSNFDISSTPVAVNRYSNLREQELHVDKFKIPNEQNEQGNIMYNSKKKPPSAHRSLKKANELVGQNTFVSNFNDKNQADLFNTESPMKHQQMKQTQNNLSSGKAMGSFYVERNSQPCEPSKFGQNFNALDQQTYQSNSNQVNSSSQNIGSSLFMKYIKKKANQEQKSSNFPNLYVDSHQNEPMQTYQMEHNNSGLPQSDQMIDYQRQDKVKENAYLNEFSGQKMTTKKAEKDMGHSSVQKQRQQSNNRIHSAAINSKHGPQVINQEIINTKELINEIKQMRVHQQMQLQFQQQLQQQLQNQFQMQLQYSQQEQPQFVQFNQINYYENQKPQVFSDNYLQPDQIAQNLKNQGVVKDMMQHLNTSNNQSELQGLQNQHTNYNSVNNSAISQNYDNSPIKTRSKKSQIDPRQQVQLQAEDKIPQGLQALMNKQTNMHDMQHLIMSTGYSQDKRLSHAPQTKAAQKTQYSSNPNKHLYVSNHNSDMIVMSDKGRIRRAETRGAERRKDLTQNQQLTQAHFHHNSNMKLNQPQQATQLPMQAQQSIRAKSTYKNQNSKSQSNLTQSFQPNSGGQSSVKPHNKNINYSFQQSNFQKH